MTFATMSFATTSCLTTTFASMPARVVRRQFRTALQYFARAMAAAAVLIAIGTPCLRAQSASVERTFPASKSDVEKALKKLQSSMSGHLPTLEGFAQTGEHPLSRYQRAFYQCTTQVSATPSGGSVVRVNAKVTAWYADPSASHSGYQLLTSNGRLESDLLDQLSDQISATSASRSTSSSSGDLQLPVVSSSPPPKQKPSDEPTISAPTPGSGTKSAFSAPGSQPLSASDLAVEKSPDTKSSPKESDLRAETASLLETLKNQAHPKNLVAVKKSGTPVVGSPSLGGKTLFLASAHDEFEMLDFNADWVHVRISGLSRGWIWRTSLEMPEGIPDVPKAAPAAPTAADLFQVSREETAQFPGDWQPLRGKNVKIISVQKIRENEQDSGPTAKLEYAKSLLDKTYNELAKSPDLSGIVLIFDSADGGMIAATIPTIQRWKAGSLTDAALWHQCYFDPPETFTVSSVSGTR